MDIRSLNAYQTQSIQQVNKATKKEVAINNVEDQKLKKACTEMEAVFLNMLMQQMRTSLPKKSLLGQSSQQKTMQSMLDAEMTKELANAGGAGIADVLYKQLAQKK